MTWQLREANDLVAQDGWQHAWNEAGGQVFGQQTDEVPAVVERRQFAAAAGTALVIHPRQGLVLAFPTQKSGAKSKVDVFEVHEKRLVEEADVGEHGAAIRGGAAHGPKNGARAVPGWPIRLAGAALAG